MSDIDPGVRISIEEFSFFSRRYAHHLHMFHEIERAYHTHEVSEVVPSVSEYAELEDAMVIMDIASK